MLAKACEHWGLTRLHEADNKQAGHLLRAKGSFDNIVPRVRHPVDDSSSKKETIRPCFQLVKDHGEASGKEGKWVGSGGMKMGGTVNFYDRDAIARPGVWYLYRHQ